MIKKMFSIRYSQIQKHVIFETIENKIPRQKVIDVKTGIQRDASGIKLNVPSLNRGKNKECYSDDGKIMIEDPSTGKNIR